ncbi:hypothetical protein HMPREF1986_01901 [Oribacterium sp. oral taxon 078 str. F0263]|nr:hypothetical protein HMPREF1986_01901 [Oribacterium sp. oral taxon 078 str. F0263]
MCFAKSYAAARRSSEKSRGPRNHDPQMEKRSKGNISGKEKKGRAGKIR